MRLECDTYMTRERARRRSRLPKSKVEKGNSDISTSEALMEFEEDRRALNDAEREVVRRIKEMRKELPDRGPRAGKNPAYIWSDGLSED